MGGVGVRACPGRLSWVREKSQEREPLAGGEGKESVHVQLPEALQEVVWCTLPQAPVQFREHI